MLSIFDMLRINILNVCCAVLRCVQLWIEYSKDRQIVEVVSRTLKGITQRRLCSSGQTW